MPNNWIPQISLKKISSDGFRDLHKGRILNTERKIRKLSNGKNLNNGFLLKDLAAPQVKDELGLEKNKTRFRVKKANRLNQDLESFLSKESNNDIKPRDENQPKLNEIYP